MSKFAIIAVTPLVFQRTLDCLAAVAAAVKAGAIGILDLEYAAADKSVELSAIKQALETGAISGIKCGVTDLSRWQTLFPASSGACVMVLTPGASGTYDTGSLQDAVKQARQLKWQIFVEAVNTAECRLAQQAGADAVIAKGNESGGRVSAETSFVLLQRCLRETEIPVWAQGGIGKHTASGCYVAGAAGVVLDSQLLLTREAVLPVEMAAYIARMDGTETLCLDGPQGISYRVFTRQSVKSSEELLSRKKDDLDSWSQAVTGYIAGSGLNYRAVERVLPIGQDASFAGFLAKEYVTVGGVIHGVLQSARRQAELAAGQKSLLPQSGLAVAHGTQYPLLQGAMTRVSDTAEFALEVAAGGSLPFLALALMRGNEIDGLLAECAKKIAPLPWGVGILGFVPEQLRQEQLEVVLRHKPPFALIAGGRPDQAKALEEKGIASYLHVPSPLLLKSFMELGSRRFIFEGRECGGHVGPRSSFVLWEAMVSTLLSGIGPREDASAYHVVFAGGIHDSISASMVAAIAAVLVEKGVRVGYLMGTAYLFTQEAVAAGAIVDKFQQAALQCKDTVLLETGPGHAIRVLDSPYRETFDNERRNLEAQGAGRDEIREQLELMNLGRLRIASKGVARAGKENGLQSISAEEQWSQGMYMIGQVAAMHQEPVSIKQLHEEVCLGGNAHLEQVQIDDEAVAEILPGTNGNEAIAIVGMSCLFPQAQDVESFWRNILEKVDAITEIPSEQWDWKNYYDADPLAPDKIASKWGGFLQPVKFDPMRYGIPPSSLASIDPMQVLILEAARNALDDAGYNRREFPRQNTSVVLANAGHGPITALYSLRSMLGWKLNDFDPALKKWLQDELPEWTEDSFAGYLGNVTAGRVANRFDLGGINFSIDAACASSLAALYVAVNELRNRTSDVVLLAATDTHNQPGDYLSFSKTHALSPHGRCRTFDASADGIVISEGIAMLVLKRLSDAERDGDRIYAVVKGIGGSSDGRDLSLTAPRPAGQMVALDRAYQNAGVSPASVTLVEAHGTGTVAGDKAEIEALKKVFQKNGARNRQCAVGSVKTNIGHTKAAAGLASIIKVAKSLYHKTLPPTIGVKVPNPACNFPESPFYINSELRPWLNDGYTPRRAGVSAFGFGGTNFHAVLEEYVDGYAKQEKSVLRNWPSELFVLQAESQPDLFKQIERLKNLAGKQVAGDDGNQTLLSRLAYLWYVRSLENRQVTSGKVLAIIAGGHDDLLEKLQRAEQAITSGIAEIKDPRGIYFALGDNLKSGKIACLFPGQGSQQVNMLRDLSLYFPQVRKNLEQANKVLQAALGQNLTDYIYPLPVFTEQENQAQHNQLTQTNIAQPAVGAADLAVWNLLAGFGVKPDMLAGHSYGEYVALCVAGVMNQAALLEVSAERGRILSASKNGVMAAVAAGHEQVTQIVKSLPGVTLANINSPKQCILAGDQASIAAAVKHLEATGLAARPIAVSAAFHSPHMKEARAQLEACLQKISTEPAQIPVYSNVTAKAYDQEYSALAESLGKHLVSPVKFMQQVQSMYDDGARIFIEVGPSTVLSNLVDDILAQQPHLTVACDRQGRNGATQLQHALGQLLSAGVSLNLEPLYQHRFGLQEEVMLNQDSLSSGNAKLRSTYLVDSAKIIPAHSSPDKKALLPFGKSVAPPSNSIAGNAKVQRTMVVSNNAVNTTPVKPDGQALDQAGHTTVVKPVKNGRANLEQVMLQYQQTMLQMTNSFLQAQQNVMLAYLQASGQGGTEVLQAMQQSMQAFQPVLTPNLPAGAFAAPALPEAENAATPVLEAQQASEESAVADTGSDKGISADELVAGLIEIVSQRTGYPPEMLDPSLDLESDLGIDSIKRVEILSSFRKLLPESKVSELEGEIEKLAGTKTLQGIIDWIRSSYSGGSSVAVATVAKVNEPVQAASVKPGQVSRGTVAVSELPEISFKPLSIGSWLIAEADCQATKMLAEALTAQGHKVVVVSQAAQSKKISSSHYQADLTVPEQVESLVEKLRHENGAITGLIHLLGVNSQPANETLNAVDTRSLFVLAKALHGDMTAAGAREKAAVIVATTLGGEFGTASDGMLDNFPGSKGGVIGIAKTLAREWPEVQVKAVDFAAAESPQFIADKLLAEAACDDRIWEVGYAGKKRIGLEVRSSSVKQRTHNQFKLDKSSVVLITGGARGITAEIAMELAQQYQPTLVIVGRLPRPEAQEAADTALLTSARELKAAIMERLKQNGQTVSIAAVESVYQKLLREREIRSNLAKMERFGSTVKYYSLDVRDSKALTELVERLYESLGRIDGVIHGAGVIEDAYLKDKSQESFDRVYLTKVTSAHTLCRCLRLDQLKFITFFSSVVGRTGNAGQCDYVAANETINKLMVWLDAQTPARVASIMWGPWNGGMAQPELEAVFARYGWSMIDAQDGRLSFMEELTRGQKGEVEVLLVGQLEPSGGAVDSQTQSFAAAAIERQGARLHQAQASSKGPGEVEFNLTLNLDEDKYLHDHCFDGIPVLPMAMAMELMVEAVQSSYPQWRLARLLELDIPSGIVFDSSKKDIVLTVKQEAQSPDAVKVQVALQTGKEPKRRVNFKAAAELVPVGAPPVSPEAILPAGIPLVFQLPQFKEPLTTLPTVESVYEKWLFHGPLFQNITSIDAMGINGISGGIKLSQADLCLRNTGGFNWAVDPVMWDSAMQLAGIWARQFLDMTVLPTGFTCLHLFNQPQGEKLKAIVDVPVESKHGQLLCNLAVYDETGNLVMLAEDLGGIGSRSFNRLSKPAKELRPV